MKNANAIIAVALIADALAYFWRGYHTLTPILYVARETSTSLK